MTLMWNDNSYYSDAEQAYIMYIKVKATAEAVDRLSQGRF